ncbi:partial transposase in ISC1229 [Saccharolobus solfataricus]|uniref:Partial transposase in ISC1229 n=1 Tax=Saccharolobus solfataricus TaxID=2287 RepID=A0A157T4Q2_SACSO|nr:partial transposase in ISC1229 [Saccharolobus solfataricus]
MKLILYIYILLLKTDLLTVIFIKYMQLYLNKTGAVQSYIYYHLYQKNEIPILIRTGSWA